MIVDHEALPGGSLSHTTAMLVLLPYSTQGPCYHPQQPCWVQVGRPGICVHPILYVTYSEAKRSQVTCRPLSPRSRARLSDLFSVLHRSTN